MSSKTSHRREARRTAKHVAALTGFTLRELDDLGGFAQPEERDDTNVIYAASRFGVIK